MARSWVLRSLASLAPVATAHFRHFPRQGQKSPKSTRQDAPGSIAGLCMDVDVVVDLAL
jgi:hypothetical protein